MRFRRHFPQPAKRRTPQKGRSLDPERFSLIGALRRHPLRVAGLATCVIGGALLGATFLPDDLATARRIVGGGLLGGLSWLIPNFGRIIDGG